MTKVQYNITEMTNIFKFKIVRLFSLNKTNLVIIIEVESSRND